MTLPYADAQVGYAAPMRVLIFAAGLLLPLLLAPRSAPASCPESSWDEGACIPIDAYFMPGLVGLGYFPSESPLGDGFLGAGVQIVPFLWSHNTDKFGPGQGKLIFDIGLLNSDQDEVDRMLLYRFGAQLSFERNASRSFAIPFFGFMMGGLQQTMIEHVGFVETTLGLHAVFMKNVAVTLEGGYLFPFDKVDELAGYRATLGVNFTAW
jgi:hypothetical protein